MGPGQSQHTPGGGRRGHPQRGLAFVPVRLDLAHQGHLALRRRQGPVPRVVGHVGLVGVAGGKLPVPVALQVVVLWAGARQRGGGRPKHGTEVQESPRKCQRGCQKVAITNPNQD